MEPKRTYNGEKCCVKSLVSCCVSLAHSNRVTALKFNAENNWLLSASRDKSFEWYCTSTGRQRGNFKTQSWCTAVEYPLTSYVCHVSYFLLLKNSLTQLSSWIQ